MYSLLLILGNSNNKVGHCYFDFTQYCHDTNLNISVLMEILRGNLKYFEI